MNHQISILRISVFLWLFFGTMAFAADRSEQKARPELSLKIVFNTPVSDWAPGFGGAVAIEYAVLKYFSLATELSFRETEVRPALG